ncbi:sugar ABC transporter permease [Facklamia sp. DSM 111018]|uniref:Sugar ABC transporter permease n=1 Tax=Facklamia lactis TaxID=2749967 RepID=A0ABS0LNQ4_9LACT|nr:sugar ABC transporter permease [Facklamia lactis]MBG9979587.1 sugar ABC transporter permease [Facklamia lactis]MBG9985733.1 sugar ABC transporter permease [Facklamia lactis]
MKIKQQNNFQSVLYLLPTLVLFGVFIVWPLIYTIYLSFFRWNMISADKDFVGFDNYMKLFSNPLTSKIMWNSVQYILWIALFAFVIPYILAFILDRLVPRFIDFYKGALFVPAVMSLVVASMLFAWILNPLSGPVALILRSVGVAMPFWSNTDGWVIFVIALVVIWKVFGYNFILLYAAVSGIDQEIIESAKVDNISNFRIFTQMVLPLSSATGIYVLIISVVQALQYVFTPISVLTQGGPNYGSSNIIYESYRLGFITFKTGESAALSVITLLICVVLLVIEYVFVERGVYYEN